MKEVRAGYFIEKGFFTAIVVTLFLHGIYIVEKRGIQISWELLIGVMVGALIFAVIIWVVGRWLRVIFCWPKTMWGTVKSERLLTTIAFCVSLLPFLHAGFVWQHNNYMLTLSVQTCLIAAVIWYFLCGVAVNIVFINVDGCGFLEFPKISDFKRNILA